MAALKLAFPIKIRKSRRQSTPLAHTCIRPWRPEVGIYKRKKEIKNERKHAFDQESDQEEKKVKLIDILKLKTFFLDSSLGHFLGVFFLFFSTFLFFPGFLF